MSIRNRIVLVFCGITILLSVLLSRLSFVALRDLYVEQLSSEVKRLVGLSGSQLDIKYLDYADLRIRGNTAETYFRRQLERQREALGSYSLFIFDAEQRILVSTDSAQVLGEVDPLLVLNRKEISDATKSETTAGFLFKGPNGTWYMWGFARLGADHWLGVRESSDRLAIMDNLSSVFWLIVLLGIVITIAGGILIARSIAQPIDRLIVFSQNLVHNLKAPVPKKVSGELALLSGALDRMRIGLVDKQKEKEKILAEIAHEIRNPLASVEVLSGLIREDLIRSGQKADYADTILKEISVLKSLITAYLEYGRPAPPVAMWNSLKQTIQGIREVLMAESNKKAIRISDDVNGTTVWFDPQHLKQVLYNIVRNGIDAVAEGGEVTIHADDSDHEICIRINDNGPGLNSIQAQKLFEPFFTTKPGGFGLGLAVSKRLCIENGATISAIPDNKGGRFVVTIPKKVT